MIFNIICKIIGFLLLTTVVTQFGLFEKILNKRTLFRFLIKHNLCFVFFALHSLITISTCVVLFFIGLMMLIANWNLTIG